MDLNHVCQHVTFLSILCNCSNVCMGHKYIVIPLMRNNEMYLLFIDIVKVQDIWCANLMREMRTHLRGTRMLVGFMLLSFGGILKHIQI
jgi:predicted  nucleic acid-binding Zn ribbon protein